MTSLAGRCNAGRRRISVRTATEEEAGISPGDLPGKLEKLRQFPHQVVKLRLGLEADAGNSGKPHIAVLHRYAVGKTTEWLEHIRIAISLPPRCSPAAMLSDI